jgi:hypothetical protein
MLHNNNSPNSKIFVYLAFFGIFFILFGNIGVNLFQVYSQEQPQNQKANSIVLTAELLDESYRWVEADGNKLVNPTLNLTSGIDNQITVKSLQNDSPEHQIIIDGITSDGDKKELVKSDEIKGGSSDTIKFNPEDVQDKNYQSFEYYCEYHPDTMRGKVQIIK